MKNVKLRIISFGSIKTRLALFYTLAVFILLTVTAVLLYWETTNILYKADYEFLADEVGTIQYILNNKKVNMASLKQEVIDIPRTSDDSSIYRYYTRIFDDKKKIIIETPGMQAILPVDKTFNRDKTTSSKKYGWYVKDDNNYLVIEAPIKLSGNKKIGLIQIVLDITYQHAIINDRKTILLAVLIWTLCALFLGFFIAHRGMRSLYVLTETAKKITADSLHERINPKSWPQELRTLGEAFNQMLERIENAFLRLNQFSADLAHELRTPIHNLIGETEIALSHANSLNEYQEVLASNMEELQRVSQLIENILFLTRVENPQLNLHKKLLNAHSEIKTVCEFYQAIADEKGIAVSTLGEAQVQAHPVMFKRMISNLLSNSLKYTQPFGSIFFTIKEINKQMTEIILTDNGIGITAENLPKIFDRFYRIDAARSQDPAGIGLGLSIVKSIVDLHHATINILSEPGKGTTVILTFPR